MSAPPPDTRPGDLTVRHRETDAGPVKVTREIPLPWLIGITSGIIFSAGVQITGQVQQQKSIDQLTIEIKELRSASRISELKTVEYGLRLDAHDRRIQIIKRMLHAQRREFRTDARKRPALLDTDQTVRLLDALDDRKTV